MEKRDVKVKCTGCGTAFKLRIPLTDKPVSFTCKKCGKVMKLRIEVSRKKEPEPALPPMSGIDSQPQIERGQIGDEEDLGDLIGMGLHPPSTPSEVDTSLKAQPPQAAAPRKGQERRWLILFDNVVKGPFTDNEVVKMIRDGEVTASNSIRLGERPWIQASKVATFSHLFAGGASGAGARKRAEEEDDDEMDGGTAFIADISSAIQYPVRGGNWQPLAIFAGITLVLSAALCLEFFIGLILNIVGWIILYGYLESLMRESMKAPAEPPPDWNFAGARQMAVGGARIFAVLLVFSLLPVGLFLLLMIAMFLNSMTLLGHVFMVLTVVVFGASLYVVPAGLLALANSGSVGLALSPGNIVATIKDGRQSYLMLAGFSAAAGMLCMLVTILSVLLVDIPLAGFVVAALLMASVFTYGHFVWFHVMGRYLGANRGRLGPAVSAA